MAKREKKEKPILKILSKVIIVLILLACIIAVTYIASKNYVRDDIKGKINLIINNSNVTKDLKEDIFVKDGVVYISKADVSNFLDNTITYDEQYNGIITCSEKKVANLPIGQKEITVNSSTVKIKGEALKRDENYYIPLSELGDVYNISTNYYEENGIVTVDSLDRAYTIATVGKNFSVKYKPTGISRTVAKVKQGDTLIIANRSQYPVPDGWTRVRTENGILGYAKIKNMGENNQIRENIESKPKMQGNISLVWDYFSNSAYAPDRTGTTIQGVNVVSPAFFSLEDEGKGNVKTNVDEPGKKYVAWAHEQGYKVWPMLSNNSYINTTSEIIRDYKLREKLINTIVDYIVTYQLDGINIDFENMYEADKDYFSRFLIELEPRLNEIGAVLSVDVTAPDGSPNWSLCYDRHVIGKVADYVMFMAYDQYGISSDKAGTTAGYDWVEANIQKFLGQEEVPSEKLVMGIPFYTRLWKEQEGKKIESYTVDAKDVDKVLPENVEKKWDENLKQYYVEYTQNNATYKMWVEDEKSLTEKLDLVTKYKLAGAAYWTKGREPESIWNIISEKLNVRL